MNITMAGILAMLGLVAAFTSMAGAHAYASGDDVKTVGKWSFGKAVAPDELDTAINDTRAQLCSGGQPSAGCGIGGAALDAAETRVKATEARATISVIVVAIGIVGSIAAAAVRRLGRY